MYQYQTAVSPTQWWTHTHPVHRLENIHPDEHFIEYNIQQIVKFCIRHGWQSPHFIFCLTSLVLQSYNGSPRNNLWGCVVYYRTDTIPVTQKPPRNHWIISEYTTHIIVIQNFINQLRPDVKSKECFIIKQIFTENMHTRLKCVWIGVGKVDSSNQQQT